jgi:hypothetical protein
VPKQTRDMLQAVSRIANELASRSSGGEVRVVSRALASATVSAGATGITFLATCLPDN